MDQKHTDNTCQKLDHKHNMDTTCQTLAHKHIIDNIWEIQTHKHIIDNTCQTLAHKHNMGNTNKKAGPQAQHNQYRHWTTQMYERQIRNWTKWAPDKVSTAIRSYSKPWRLPFSAPEKKKKEREISWCPLMWNTECWLPSDYSCTKDVRRIWVSKVNVSHLVSLRGWTLCAWGADWRHRALKWQWFS